MVKAKPRSGKIIMWVGKDGMVNVANPHISMAALKNSYPHNEYFYADWTEVMNEPDKRTS